MPWTQLKMAIRMQKFYSSFLLVDKSYSSCLTICEGRRRRVPQKTRGLLLAHLNSLQTNTRLSFATLIT